MKLRLKPLRGQTYSVRKGLATFLDKMKDGKVRVVFCDRVEYWPIVDLELPIIDTKDYEKIEDTKYKGD